MTAQEIQDAARRQPFEPFRVHITTGETFDIWHPDLIMVGRRVVIIGIAKGKKQLFDRSMKVDLLHVVAIEDLPAKAKPSSNGPS